MKAQSAARVLVLFGTVALAAFVISSTLGGSWPVSAGVAAIVGLAIGMFAPRFKRHAGRADSGTVALAKVPRSLKLRWAAWYVLYLAVAAAFPFLAFQIGENPGNPRLAWIAIGGAIVAAALFVPLWRSTMAMRRAVAKAKQEPTP